MSLRRLALTAAAFTAAADTRVVYNDLRTVCGEHFGDFLAHAPA